MARFFTYGTPHGGIAFKYDALDWVEQTFGPAGSGIFAPEKMYGYLDPRATFGDLPPAGSNWDPQELPENVFSTDDVFCLIGTDPKDYGLPRVAVGPKSDGLVFIEHAYVRKAHRAYVYKSHSGTYGEVNSRRDTRTCAGSCSAAGEWGSAWRACRPTPARGIRPGRCGRPTCG